MVGLPVGPVVGSDVVGVLVGSVGSELVGMTEGIADGIELVGIMLGAAVGSELVGTVDGTAVGTELVGIMLGAATIGAAEGGVVGSAASSTVTGCSSHATFEFQRIESAAVMKGITRMSVGSVSPRSATWMVWSMSPDTPMGRSIRSALASDPSGSTRLIKILRFAMPGMIVVT